MRNIATGQGEDNTTGCLLDYDYIKNHYRSRAVDLSRQKQLDADPKVIQQTECVGQLKDVDSINADGTQNMFILMILEKIKESRLKFSQGSVTVKNTFPNNMSTNMNFSKVEITKIIQSSGFLHNMLGNLGKKVTADLAIPLARDNLPGLVRNLISNTTNKFE